MLRCLGLGPLPHVVENRRSLHCQRITLYCQSLSLSNFTDSVSQTPQSEFSTGCELVFKVKNAHETPTSCKLVDVNLGHASVSKK